MDQEAELSRQRGTVGGGMRLTERINERGNILGRQTDGDGAVKEEREMKHDGKIKQREEKVKTPGNVSSSSGFIPTSTPADSLRASLCLAFRFRQLGPFPRVLLWILMPGEDLLDQPRYGGTPLLHCRHAGPMPALTHLSQLKRSLKKLKTRFCHYNHDLRTQSWQRFNRDTLRRQIKLNMLQMWLNARFTADKQNYMAITDNTTVLCGFHVNKGAN